MNITLLTTCVMQPADVAWFKNLKESYIEQWNDCFLNEEKKLVRHDNHWPGYE
jgi:hypothetical protein